MASHLRVGLRKAEQITLQPITPKGGKTAPKVLNQRKGSSRRIFVFCCASLLPLITSLPSTAQVSSTADETPVSFRNCDSFSLTLNPVQTENTICQQGLTPPSLWWIKEQVGSQLGKKLISGWRAELGEGDRVSPKVVLMVNTQAWSLLDYFERYEFLHAFGLTTQDFGYELEVRDSRDVAMATYSCKSEGCKIKFGGSGSGFSGGSRRLF